MSNPPTCEACNLMRAGVCTPVQHCLLGPPHARIPELTHLFSVISWNQHEAAGRSSLSGPAAQGEDGAPLLRARPTTLLHEGPSAHRDPDPPELRGSEWGPWSQGEPA